MGELNSGQSAADSSVSSPAGSQSEGLDDSPRGLMSQFYALQEERVQTYQMFEEGFKAYLHGGPSYNFPLYRQLVHEITQTFNKISADILSIKARFSNQNNLLSVVEIIEKIQNAEKSKLELTAKLQLCRKKQQDEPGDEADTEADDVKQQLKENQDFLIEQMEELKYESEDLYAEDSEPSPAFTDSTGSVDR